MSDRDRIRRPEPVRTDPVRNLSAAFGRGDGAAAAAPGATAPSADVTTGPTVANPFAWAGDDAVSRAVRAGCDVVEKALRRGFGLGGDPRTGPAWAGPSIGGSLPASWTTGQWVDTMTSAYTQWVQWVDAWSSMARSVGGGSGEPGAARWSPAPSSPASPSAEPRPVAGRFHVTVELRTARAVSVQLDLSPDLSPGLSSGLASGVPAPLEVHGLLAPAAAAAPPITDVTVAIVDGGAVVALGSLEQHPAATYAGAVLAAGRACGTLTVRLT